MTCFFLFFCKREKDAPPKSHPSVIHRKLAETKLTEMCKWDTKQVFEWIENVLIAENVDKEHVKRILESNDGNCDLKWYNMVDEIVKDSYYKIDKKIKHDELTKIWHDNMNLNNVLVEHQLFIKYLLKSCDQSGIEIERVSF